MSQCPHCNKNGINILARLWSGSAFAVRCKYCGQLSYMASKTKYAIGAFLNIAVFIAVGASFYYSTWLPIITFCVVAVILYLVAGYKCRMIAVTEEQASINKLNGNILVLSSVLLFLLFVLLAE